MVASSPSILDAAPKARRAPAVDVTVVIVSWNTASLTTACLDALKRDPTRFHREIVVVDNASEDGTADAVAREHPDVVLVRNAQNRLYAAANNQGVALARGRYVCLLNSDARVKAGALDQLVEFLDAHPGHAAVAPKLVGEDGVVQRACSRFPGLGSALAHSTSFGRLPAGARIKARTRMEDFDHEESRDVDQPPTSCLLVRKRDWDELGGFDPRLSLYFNDVDLCFRLWQRGRRIHYLAGAEVVHQAGGSTRRAREVERDAVWNRNREVYFEKHYGPVGKLWVRAVLATSTAEVAARIVAARARDATRQLRSLSEQVRLSIGGEVPIIAVDATPVTRGRAG